MKVLFIIIMYVFRPVWSAFFNIFYWLYYNLIYLLNPTKRLVYHANKNEFDNIKTLEELVYYFTYRYQYNYDGYKGIIDHDNLPIEFFMDWGDCEDVAHYAKKKLKKIGYKPVRVFIKGTGLTASHFDVSFEKDGKIYLFNYGSLIGGKTLKDCMDFLGDKWGAFKNAMYFKYYL